MATLLATAMVSEGCGGCERECDDEDDDDGSGDGSCGRDGWG